MEKFHIKGFLVGSRILIFDEAWAKKLYELGVYGKPFGIRKPKSVEDVKAPLELSIVEATYLVEKGVMKVFRGDGSEVGVNDLLEIGRKVIPNFDDLYIVYKDLRERGFIVRSGLKFGADFAIYTERPGVQHAPYLIKVFKGFDKVDPIDLVGLGRLSHSVRKRLILAVITPSNEIKYVMLKWVKM
ncbi:MAG TPA: tRNA-intron lyase [Acidilobales archaeon]|nr:tRNA-intron lyase [Acidilobales archaeon]